MKLDWNFSGGGRVQNKKPYVEGVWIFSGTAYCKNPTFKSNPSKLVPHTFSGCNYVYQGVCASSGVPNT